MNPKIDALLGSVLHRLEADGRPIPHNIWQNALSKTLQSCIPPLHHSPWMEWEYGTWVGAFAGYDELGRQLGEANVVPEWRASPLKDNWRSFKGGGIRQGHPYNVDAMHEMVHCWDDLLLDAATLRTLYCQHFKRDSTQRLAAKDLYIMTSVAVSLSSFLLRRGDRPTADGALPRQVAAAFKVIGGMYAASNRMLSQAHPMLMDSELDVEAFMQYLEDESLLLSPEMRACAGPVKMIRQMLGALVDPTDSPPKNGFTYLGDDVDRAFAYGVLCVRIDLMVLLYWRSLGHYLAPLLQDSDTPTKLRAALLDEVELGMEDTLSLQAFNVLIKHILGLFESCEPEQSFLSGLPAFDEQSCVDIGSISANCHQLERAMRVFACQQQTALNQVLQRQTPALSVHTWSPAPGSSFLNALLAMDSRMTDRRYS